jgi:HEPN domain-containing protein
MSKNRAKNWLKQALNDLEWARAGLEKKFFSQACFMSQQAAEKAIKAIAFSEDFEVRSHSIVSIAKELKINSAVETAARRLDLYYISARYPDALPDGAPFEVLGEEQAKEAIDDAALIIRKSSERLKGLK